MTKPFSYRGKIISASSKSEAISKITANKKKGGGSYRSTTKESKTSRDRKEINLILKSIRDVAKSSGLVTDFTAGGDELIHGKDGIKNDNSFSIFACDYNSRYVVRGIKGYYSTYTPDLRACERVGQFKVNLKSDSLFTILSAYSRIANIIAKYTKKDKSAWSKFATEVHKIDLDKLKSDKESARDNAKKEAIKKIINKQFKPGIKVGVSLKTLWEETKKHKTDFGYLLDTKEKGYYDLKFPTDGQILCEDGEECTIKSINNKGDITLLNNYGIDETEFTLSKKESDIAIFY